MMTKKNKIKIKAFNSLDIFGLFVMLAAATIWMPHSLPFFFDKFNLQMLGLVFFLPLAVLALFYGDEVGFAFARLAHKWFGKRGSWLGILMLMVVQAVCEVLCMGHEYYIAGYPYNLCLNENCVLVELPMATLIYTIMTTLLFLPAYWTAIKYASASRE